MPSLTKAYPGFMVKRMRLYLTCLLLIGPLLTPSITRASTVMALDLQELVGGANEIVIGRIASKRYLKSNRGQIMTEYTVAIRETIKGSSQAKERVLVYQPGGVIDGIGMRVAGTPVFEINQDYLLFARSSTRIDGQGLVLFPIGMSQGALRIHYDKAGNQTVLPSSDLHAVTYDSRTGLRAASGAVNKPVALSTLLNRVREYIASQRAQSR